ncbi:hypothetical protein RHGRI_011961 [Rhododendron griersonianum]|uniref:HMG box domain-containing protein n=1 Tax=Rhododendron griersonianum TaxID=479676 RepID=A0AAV6KNR1_9ERIC|nr:hypothetical protein RHGRI_011961 [Rhododendron griersonianum]
MEAVGEGRTITIQATFSDSEKQGSITDEKMTGVFSFTGEDDRGTTREHYFQTSMVATNQHLQPKRHHTNAFLFYSHEQLKHNKEGNHRLNKGVMKNIGDRWKLLSQDEKQLFYLDNVSPTFESTYATTRSIPHLNDWGDSQLKKTFRLFRKLGGFRNEVKVTFSKPNQMNDHHVDVVKTEIYDDMRHDIGELKHTMISMKEKIMNWEQKTNAPGDGVETRQQIGELKDVVYNLHQVIIKHIVRPDQLAAANGLDCFNSVAEKMNDEEGVKAANKIGATAKTKIAHDLMSEKNNGEESDDGPSIEFLGVKERALKNGRKGQVIKEKEAMGSPPAEHSLPILGSQRGRAEEEQEVIVEEVGDKLNLALCMLLLNRSTWGIRHHAMTTMLLQLHD